MNQATPDAILYCFEPFVSSGKDINKLNCRKAVYA